MDGPQSTLAEIVNTLQNEVCEGKRSNASAIRDGVLAGYNVGKTEVFSKEEQKINA